MFLPAGSLAVGVLKIFMNFFPELLCTETFSSPYYMTKISKVLRKHNTGWDSSYICVSRNFAIRKRSGAPLLSQMCWEEGRSYLPFPECQSLLDFPSFLSVLGLHREARGAGPRCGSDRAWGDDLRLVNSSG